MVVRVFYQLFFIVPVTSVDIGPKDVLRISLIHTVNSEITESQS